MSNDTKKRSESGGRPRGQHWIINGSAAKVQKLVPPQTIGKAIAEWRRSNALNATPKAETLSVDGWLLRVEFNAAAREPQVVAARHAASSAQPRVRTKLRKFRKSSDMPPRSEGAAGVGERREMKSKVGKPLPTSTFNSAKDLTAPYAAEIGFREVFLAQLASDRKEYRVLPVRVFLASNERTSEVKTALEAVARALRTDIVYDGRARTGSWFKGVFVRTRDKLAKADVDTTIDKVSKALEVQQLTRPQAEADSALLTSTAALVTAIGDRECAVQVGTLLFVNRRDANGRIVSLIRTLSVAQLMHLESNRDLLATPNAIIQSLDAVNEESASERIGGPKGGGDTTSAGA